MVKPWLFAHIINKVYVLSVVNSLKGVKNKILR